MRSPKVGKPRAASAASSSLSRKLPRLQLPQSAASGSSARPKPQVGRPGKNLTNALAGRK